ncbi:hypothetical protein DFH09DRAFT_1125767 [Mycena vulgaris]|nr:hypothetical protein DFH09DRAFT_1125767 [Mycena vulgaris]
MRNAKRERHYQRAVYGSDQQDARIKLKERARDASLFRLRLLSRGGALSLTGLRGRRAGAGAGVALGVVVRIVVAIGVVVVAVVVSIDPHAGAAGNLASRVHPIHGSLQDVHLARHVLVVGLDLVKQTYGRARQTPGDTDSRARCYELGRKIVGIGRLADGPGSLPGVKRCIQGSIDGFQLAHHILVVGLDLAKQTYCLERQIPGDPHSRARHSELGKIVVVGARQVQRGCRRQDGHRQDREKGGG